MAIYKSHMNVHIPRNQNLTELLHSSARPGSIPKDHVIFEDDLEKRKLTLQDLRQNAGSLANGLSVHYNPPDQSRWAVILPNCITLIEAAHAVLWLGGVFCPINHQLMPSEIAHSLLLSKPKYIIAYQPIIGKVEEAVNISIRQNPQYAKPQLIVALGDNSTDNYPSLHKAFASTQTLPVPHYEDTQNRLASIHTSSGTTGLPKGVSLSHLNYISNVYELWSHDPDHWTTNESVISITPFVHLANGVIPFYLGPWTGMRHIIMASYALEALGKLVEASKPTTIQMLPPIVKAVVRSDITKRYDFSSVKRINGVYVGLEQHEVESFFGPGKWQTMQMYGLTEAACWVAMQKISERLPVGDIGSLLPGMEARLVIEGGQDAPRGGPGELWLKGTNITSGYIDNPEASKGAFPEPGWFNTGDICTISPEGIVRWVGRTKELIKYNAFQVSPTELESYLIRDETLIDVGVSSIMGDEEGTELPTAYVVLDPKFSDKESKLKALTEVHISLDEQVSGYKRLRGGVWEVTQIPRNATAKVLRRNFRDFTTGLRSNKTYKKNQLKI